MNDINANPYEDVDREFGENEAEPDEEEHGVWAFLDTVILSVKALGLFLFAGVRVAGNWLLARTEREVRHLAIMAIIMAAAPALVGVIGVSLGSYGYHELANGAGDWWPWVKWGRRFIAFAGISYCFLVTYIVVRSAFWVEVLLLASSALSQITKAIPSIKWEPVSRAWRTGGQLGGYTENILPQARDRENGVPSLNPAYAHGIIRSVMGVFMAAALTFCYAFVFAVYESPESFMIAIVAGFALAFAIVHFQLVSPMFKRVSLTFIALVLIGVTLTFGYGLIRDQVSRAKHEIRQVYALEYAKLALERKELTKLHGVAIEKDDTHSKHADWESVTEKMEYIEAKRPPATPTELAVFLWRNVRDAGRWSRDQMIDAPEHRKDFVLWAKQFDWEPYRAGRDTMGTPLEFPSVDGDEDAATTPPASDSEPSDPAKEAKKKALLAKIDALDKEAEESHEATKDLLSEAKKLGVNLP